jgi:Tol biopolymer transport system component
MHKFNATRPLILVFALACLVTTSAQTPFHERLTASAFKIAYECYVQDNWEIFVMNADGTQPVNLTRTPGEHEHYPQISPDGRKIAFVSDKGEGREAVRSLCVMDIDGGNRKTLTDHAREPFWSPDGKRIGFLHQEFPKFNVMDYYTTGMGFYDLATGAIEPHPNTAKLHHLYNPGFSVDGKWIVSTVHAGMGVDHGILLIEAHGDKIINLKIPGCRPCLSPDGKQIAWGADDHEIATAPINLNAPEPAVGPRRLRVRDEKNKIYHVDWSPDSRFLCVSRGPDGEGDPNKIGTFQAACEIMGVYAPGWNLCAISAEREGLLDLNDPGEKDFSMLTTNGASNKEPAWFRGK